MARAYTTAELDAILTNVGAVGPARKALADKIRAAVAAGTLRGEARDTLVKKEIAKFVHYYNNSIAKKGHVLDPTGKDKFTRGHSAAHRLYNALQKTPVGSRASSRAASRAPSRGASPAPSPTGSRGSRPDSRPRASSRASSRGSRENPFAIVKYKAPGSKSRSRSRGSRNLLNYRNPLEIGAANASLTLAGAAAKLAGSRSRSRSRSRKVEVASSRSRSRSRKAAVAAAVAEVRRVAAAAAAANSGPAAAAAASPSKGKYTRKAPPPTGYPNSGSLPTLFYTTPKGVKYQWSIKVETKSRGHAMIVKTAGPVGNTTVYPGKVITGEGNTTRGRPPVEMAKFLAYKEYEAKVKEGYHE
jgi:hypothetical protein